MSSHFFRFVVVLVLISLLNACGGGGGGGNSSSPPPPPPPPPPPAQDGSTRVSGLTPFAVNCDAAAPNGSLFANAEVEPYFAINPRDPNNLIGVWQQDRWSGGSARGLLTGVSLDGGATWQQRQVPFSRCSGGNASNGGDYERATDPWVSFAPDGNAYQVSLSTSGATFTAGSINAMLVSRSLDGGRTWGAPVALIRDFSEAFNDKESVTADPTDARFVYVVWDRLVTANGPTYFARSTDNGNSWEAARSIYNPGIGSQTIGNEIVVLPDGMLINLFNQITTVDGRTVASLTVLRSSDKGQTWSAPVRIADHAAVGTRDPESGTAVRDGSIIARIAVNSRGEIFVVWQDARLTSGQRDAILLSRSNDRGLTWSAPVRVSRDLQVAAFTPAISISAEGMIGVSYYDFRSNTSEPSLLTDFWFAQSIDGVTWRETRISGPFDLSNAPNARGLFLGDYHALIAQGTNFVSFYPRTNPGDNNNRTDIFLRRMPVETSVALSEKRSDETSYRAEPAASLKLTKEFSDKVHDNIVRTMQQRIPGWEKFMPLHEPTSLPPKATRPAAPG